MQYITGVGNCREQVNFHYLIQRRHQTILLYDVINYAEKMFGIKSRARGMKNMRFYGCGTAVCCIILIYIKLK